METWEGLLITIGWFVLRFGVPILGTLLIVRFFTWLDQHWQREAMERRASMGAQSMLPIIQCWSKNNCPGEKCQNCMAFQDQRQPCWQHFRTVNGLKDECLSCDVFLGVSAPTVGD